VRIGRPYPLARIQPTISSAIWQRFEALAKRRGRQVSRELEAALVRYLHAEEPGGGPRAGEIPFPLCFVYRPRQERERRDWEQVQAAGSAGAGSAVAGSAVAGSAVAGSAVAGSAVAGSARSFVAQVESAPGGCAGSMGAGDEPQAPASQAPASQAPAIPPAQAEDLL
jgi:hypothetical protein